MILRKNFQGAAYVFAVLILLWGRYAHGRAPVSPGFPGRMVSLNVWGEEEGRPFRGRDVRIGAYLASSGADFIALQEMTAEHWKSAIAGRLTNAFEFAGAGGGVCLAYRRRDYRCVEKGTFRFSPETGSLNGAVWAVLRDKRRGRHFTVYSVRFREEDRCAVSERREDARKLADALCAAAAKYDAAIVGGGDFNGNSVSASSVELLSRGWRDAQKTAPGRDSRPSLHSAPFVGADGKFHALAEKKDPMARHFDRLTYDPAHIEPYAFRYETGEMRSLSDHLMLIFDFTAHEKRPVRPIRLCRSLTPVRPPDGVDPIALSGDGRAEIVNVAPEHALWHIFGGFLEKSGAKTVEVGLSADDGVSPIEVICAVRAVVDGIRERLPDAVVFLRPFVGYARRETVNREIARLADGRSVRWRGAQETKVKTCALPRTCIPTARVDVSGTRGKWWWLNRLEEKQNEIAAGTRQYDVVMIGDSITHFWEDFAYWCCGRDVFDGMRKKLSLLNLGYGGDHVENVLWRIENGELDGYRAKIVQLMIGTNNGADTPEDTARGIRLVLDAIARRQPQAKILLLPIFPRGKPDDPNRGRIAEFNRLIRPFADGDRVLWHDFTERFLKPDGSFRANLMMGDLLHPRHGGYELWRDAAMPVYEKLLGRKL